MNEFWKRVGLPFLIPLLSVAVIVVTVLNLSRILIGLEENNGPRWTVFFACMVGIALFGGFIYYASERARPVGNSAVLASAGIVIVFSGFAGAEIIQDHDNRHHAEAGPELPDPSATVIAVDNNFPEKTFSLASGEVIGYENQGSAVHTLVAEGAPTFEKLTISGKGSTAKGLVELDPGQYTFFCDVAGHRASGMEATVTVTEAGAGGGTEAPTGGSEEAESAGEGVEEAKETGEGGDESQSGGGAPQAVEVLSTLDIKFVPTELSAAKGAKVTLKNQGALPHNFVIEGEPKFKKLEVNNDGDTATGTLDLEPGDYVYFCDLPGHRQIGMEGKLKVT